MRDAFFPETSTSLSSRFSVPIVCFWSPELVTWIFVIVIRNVEFFRVNRGLLTSVQTRIAENSSIRDARSLWHSREKPTAANSISFELANSFSSATSFSATRLRWCIAARANGSECVTYSYSFHTFWLITVQNFKLSFIVIKIERKIRNRWFSNFKRNLNKL